MKNSRGFDINLVRLFTQHGPVWIDSNQLAFRTILTIYTARGNLAADMARTERERELVRYGVHRDNLFASPELARAQSERIYADMQRRAQLQEAA